MKEFKNPAISISIVKNNEIIYAKGFGFRDIENTLPATEYTIYGIGSVTKSFTALAIMKLVEQGKLSLDDKISKFITNGPKIFNEITIHHLLTHSSGIPALGYAEAHIESIIDPGSKWFVFTKPDDVLTFMKNVDNWIISKPGEKFFYLNEGYVVLGEIISKVSGLKYEDFVKEFILKPLKMNRTYFHKDEIEKDIDVAIPYIIDKNGKPIKTRYPFGITADGGLFSNVLDLSNYLIMYINRGKFNEVEIIEQKFIEFMENPYIKLPYELFGNESYGYGLIIIPNFLGTKLICHGGDVLVYTAFIGYLPNEKIGITVLSNTSTMPLMIIGMYGLALMLNKDPNKLPFIKIENILKKIEGVYETYSGTIRVLIEKKGDFLYFIRRIKYFEKVMPLIPEEIEIDYVRCYTLSYGRKIYAEFYIKDNIIELIFERYKFVKVSNIIR